MTDMAQQQEREFLLLYTPESQSASVSTTSSKRELSPESDDFYLPPHKRHHNEYLAPFASPDVGVKIETAEEEESFSSSPQSAAALHEDSPSSLDSSTGAKPTGAEEPFHLPAWPERRRPILSLQFVPPYVDRCSPIFSPLLSSSVEADSAGPSPLHQGSDTMHCKIGDYALAFPEEYQINLSPLTSSPRKKTEVPVETESEASSPPDQSSDTMLCMLGEYALSYPEEYQLYLSPIWPTTQEEDGGVSPRTIKPTTPARKDSAWSMDSDFEPKSQQPSHLTLPVSASPQPIIFRDPFAPCLRYCVPPKGPMSKPESGPDSPDYLEVFEIEQVSPSLYPSEPYSDLYPRELISVPYPRLACRDLEMPDVEISSPCTGSESEDEAEDGKGWGEEWESKGWGVETGE